MTRAWRRRQAGFGYIELGMAVAALVALAALAWAVKSYIDGVDERGYQRGVEETTATYAKRDNEALRAAIDAKEKALARVRQLEDANAAEVTAAATEYQRRLADVRATHDRFVAGVRAGTIRLRDPGNPGGAARCAGGAAPQAGPGAGGRDGAAGGELSGAAAEFLLGETARADAVVRQLQACQRIVEADRK